MFKKAAVWALGAFIVFQASTSWAFEISVANYGSSVAAMPWAVALEKGFFKDFGADITGVYASQGGTNDIRAMMAGDLPFADTGLTAVILANAKGANLKIVNHNVPTCANFVWITLPDSKITSLADIKGKKISFTSPNSTTEILNKMLIQRAGLQKEDVQLIATGTYGAALTALDKGGVDIVLLPEPNYTISKSKYKTLFFVRDTLPVITSTFGVSSSVSIEKNRDLIKGILLAHQKAVVYMRDNRDDAAAIIAKVYKMDKAVVREVITNLMDNPSIGGIPFWSEGRVYPEGADNLMKALKENGDVPADSEWMPLIDQSMLPADQQTTIK